MSLELIKTLKTTLKFLLIKKLKIITKSCLCLKYYTNEGHFKKFNLNV